MREVVEPVVSAFVSIVWVVIVVGILMVLF